MHGSISILASIQNIGALFFPKKRPDLKQTLFPCRCFDRVMDALLLKMKPNQQQPPHFFVVTTVSGLTRAYGPDSVPYLKQVMASLAASMRSVKKENLKYAYATAFAAFAEAILEHMSNNSEGGISAGLAVDRSTFCPEVDQAHDVLFSSWISSR